MNRMIIHFSKASILPSICASVHPLLHHPGVIWLKCSGQFRPPTNSDDHLPSLLSYSYFIFHFLKSIYPRAKATTYLLHIYNSILVHYLFLQSQKIFVPANVLMKAAEYTSTLCSTDSMCVDILYTLDLV